MTTRVPAEHRLLLGALPGGDAAVRTEIGDLARSGVDWGKVVEFGERLGALALLGAALDEAGVVPPAQVAARCREALVQGTLRGLYATRVLNELLMVLQARGVEGMVLKGVPLAHELYASPGLRPIGDIDLLVRAHDREGAIAALREAGYGLSAGSLPAGFFLRHHFHMSLIRAGSERLPVELHWEAQPAFSLSRIPEAGLWARRRIIACGGTEVPVPGREELFLYLAQHLLRHLLVFGEETGRDPVAALLEPSRQGRLIWLADLVLLAGRPPGLDWELIDRRAVEWGLDRDLVYLRRFLASRGVAPSRPVEADAPAPDERRLRLVRRMTSIAPGWGAAHGVLQLRPILAVELLRSAFPGADWIRRRSLIAGKGGGLVVAGLSARRAIGVLWRALRMSCEAAAWWCLGRLGRMRMTES